MIYDFRCNNPECPDRRETPDKVVTWECTLRMPASEMHGEEQYPTCTACGKRAGRIYSEQGIAEWSREKGIFPYIDENLGHEPVEVRSQRHRRQLMREQNLHDRGPTENSRIKAREARRKTFHMGSGR